MMGDTIAIGDAARLANGTLGKVISIEMFGGLYGLDVEGETVVAHRHQFQPVKWDGSVVGVTGLGVCAKGAEGQ